MQCVKSRGIHLTLGRKAGRHQSFTQQARQLQKQSISKLEARSESSSLRSTAQLRDKARTRATLRTSGLLLDVAQGMS